MLFSLFFIACSPKSKPDSSGSPAILQVTLQYHSWPGSGTNEEFTLSLQNNGKMTFNGLKRSYLDGEYKGKADKESLKNIWNLVGKMDVEAFPDSYPPMAVGADVRVLTFRKKDGEKSVQYRMKVNPQLRELEAKLIELISTQSWKKA